MTRESEDRRDGERRERLTRAQAEPAIRALHSDDGKQEDGQDLRALRAEEQTEQERRRHEARLRRGYGVESTAIIGVPERQLAIPQDGVDGRAFVEKEDVSVAELVEARGLAKDRPHERRRQ